MTSRPQQGTVFLVDLDNTLLNNDVIRVVLESAVAEAVGVERAQRFWAIYERIREDLDFVSFPEVLDRFSRECDDLRCMSRVSDALYEFPFAACLYPGALAALNHLRSLGRTAILSDGDQLFQRYKIRAAGIEAAVDGQVLVYVHKELEREDILRRFPAEHYVLLDDKPRIHAAMKRAFGSSLTTVLARQDKYAAERSQTPAPDLVLETIGEASVLALEPLIEAAHEG